MIPDQQHRFPIVDVLAPHPFGDEGSRLAAELPIQVLTRPWRDSSPDRLVNRPYGLQFGGLLPRGHRAGMVVVALAGSGQERVVRGGRLELDGGAGKRQRFGRISADCQVQASERRVALGVLGRDGAGLPQWRQGNVARNERFVGTGVSDVTGVLASARRPLRE